MLDKAGEGRQGTDQKKINSSILRTNLDNDESEDCKLIFVLQFRFSP